MNCRKQLKCCFFILNILTCSLSSVGCKTRGREAETCLVQPLGSDPNIGCSCTEWMIWWLLSWSIQLYTDKSVASFLPSYSGGKVSSVPPTRNQLHDAAHALWLHFCTGTLSNSPSHDWYFMISQSCCLHEFQSLSLPFCPHHSFWSCSLYEQFTWLFITNYRVGAVLISSIVWCFVPVICAASGKIQLNTPHVRFCLQVVQLSIWFWL